MNADADMLSLIEDAAPRVREGAPWRVLVVDDDPQVHSVTSLALDEFSFDGRPAQLISAHSAREAREILLGHDDIALILLDVVMESEHAGLDLVDFIRRQQRNPFVRIVLRTGQPGQAPPLEVIQKYDIDDYRTKTELTFDRLYVVVTAALRTFSLLRRMEDAQRQMAHLANHDSLTGLPNRALLHDRSAQAIAQSRRHQKMAALLFIDIDGFKYINDSFGHTVGDNLLCAIAARLRRIMREEDTVARLGGDEFIIVLNGLNAASDAQRVAELVMEHLPKPLQVDGRSILITASIGYCVCPGDGDDPEQMLKNADVAMYAAKQHGRNCIRAYSREMSVLADQRVELENALRQALALDQFQLHYQPKLDLQSGTICGVEALLRWTHPTLGVISPLRFIRLAEETGMILPIGEWVLTTACRQLGQWHSMGFDTLTVAVNMSARQFHQQDVATLVQAALSEAGIPAAALELELTESILISNPDAVVDTLHSLKALGVWLSMDDFGTGYSSLSYLNRFPIDIIKIDQSFVSHLQNSAEAASITCAIIALARSLRMKTIGEGVETAEQLDFLRTNGCDAVQGYHFSRAVPPEECTALLRRYNARTLPLNLQ